PMECSKCKRKAEIYYKEMENGNVNSFKMCKSCPMLQSKLYTSERTEKKEKEDSVFEPQKASCPVCGLTADEFTITLTLGCDTCAETFNDILSKELLSQDIVPTTVRNSKELEGYHFGNVPKNRSAPEFAKNIETLHLALNEAVESERFEEAATLRDQIQKHLEHPNADSA
nr:UvrB/UvrC motif-containing protein [bacterium]